MHLTRNSLKVLGRVVAALAVGVPVFLVGASAAHAQRSFDPGNPGVWETDFAKHSVPFTEIISGGVPRDGIPPIDDPLTSQIADIEEFMTDSEPVISVQVNGKARAYPLGVLTRHEIVNDELGGVPIAVTYCPLCNSAVVFDRRVDGRVLDFGVSGNLRFSDLIMWDRQTQSWWQQFVGEAIVGEMTGTLLDVLPVRVEAFGIFKERFPEGTVNAGSERFGFNRAYLQNPYAGYDQSPQPFLFFGELPQGIAPLAYVLAVGDQAWSIDLLRERLHVERDGLIITWSPGQNSVMNTQRISAGQDIGNVVVQRRNADGELEDVVHDVTFAFSFNAFNPNGTLHQ